MLNKTRWLYAGAGALAVLLIVPTAVAGYLRYEGRQRRAKLADFLHDPKAGDEGWHDRSVFGDEDEDRGESERVEHDDALRREIADAIRWGPQTPASTAHLAKVAYAEARRWPQSVPHARVRHRTGGTTVPSYLSPSAQTATAAAPSSPISGLSWVNLGPNNANFEFNGSEYITVDSGRPNTILVNPSNTSIVYLATAGGGVWKSYDFVSGSPTWQPVTESIGNLAVGAMDLDPQAPDTLYIGTGDFVDTPGGQVLKSTDGGGSWGTPVALTGTYPASAGGLAVQAMRVRDLKVDPSNSNVILVGTDVGLFRSTDGGMSFSLVDLPNSGTQRAENVWSIAYTGQVSGVSHWAITGVYACDQGVKPPDAGYGTVAGSSTPACTYGNPGDVWTSSDAGATWSSRQAAGALPAVSGGVGRITIGAGDTSNAASTVLYAQLGNEDEYNGSSGVGYWRSNNGGASWTQINGTLGNPTNSYKVGIPPKTYDDCADVNVGSEQTFYNQAVAVDPADANHVIIGGMLCGLRTLNGLSSSPTWENISHWLPSTQTASVTGGVLPYVHADWHAAHVLRTATGYVVFAGTDGGLFSSTNAFDATPPSITWDVDNKGLVTHLMYSVASGDPTDGNAYVAFAGLQDNGTRFRDTSTSNSTVFNQVVGGDGIGSAAGTNSSTGISMYWTSTEYHQYFCSPSSSNSQCNDGNYWQNADVTTSSCTYAGYGDAIPFFVYFAYAPANTTPNTFLTISDLMIYRSTGTSGTWTAISPSCFQGFTRGVVASENIAGLYGAPMSGGRFYVTGNCAGTATNCTWTMSTPIGVDLNGDGTLQSNESLTYTSSMSFPPTTPSGKQPGDVYVAATTASFMADGVTLVPASVGHLFYTQDRGTTWIPLHGNGTGYDLPNVGINVVRYDPGDATNNTLWVGTQLGIYRSTDGGQTWQRYGEGLPMVSVTDLFIAKNGGLLRASTYGRGLWEIYPSATSEKGVNGNGDWDRNLQLDGFDLGALASRLGTDPSTTAQPYYDWNLDLTGSVNAVDSNDLTAFLSNFGNHP